MLGLILAIALEPARADMTACDVVILSRSNVRDARISLAAKHYREDLERLVELIEADKRGFLVHLEEAQGKFLSQISATIKEQTYLASTACRVIVELDEGVQEIFADETMGTDDDLLVRLSPDVIAVTRMLEASLQDFLNRVRFKSERDRLKAQADGRCEVAAVLDAAMEPGPASEPLERYGATVSCGRAGRTVGEWPQ